MSSTRFSSQVTIEDVNVSVYTIPTDAPESDGTYTWDKTTIGVPVLVDGELRPDRSRPGMGLELKRSDAARYAV